MSRLRNCIVEGIGHVRSMNLANLFRRDDLQILATGDRLLAEGGENHTMFVLVEGALEIQVGKKPVETVEPGGIVGEMSLVEDLPVSADVIATAESKVAVVDGRRFQFLIQNHPLFALEVMKIMARRLRANNQRR